MISRAVKPPTGVPAGGHDVPLEVSMAFNPFAGFAKYKRFWIGAVMILVMITFVLCTGTRGGMDEFLLGKFRFGGTPVASIDGTTYYRQDFDVLLKQRKVANDYMRLYAKSSSTKSAIVCETSASRKTTTPSKPLANYPLSASC